MKLELTVDQKYTKSYKSRKTLDKALDKMKSFLVENNIRYMIHTFENGRITPVFICGRYNTLQVISLAHNGYKVVSG